MNRLRTIVNKVYVLIFLSQYWQILNPKQALNPNDQNPKHGLEHLNLGFWICLETRASNLGFIIIGISFPILGKALPYCRQCKEKAT